MKLHRFIGPFELKGEKISVSDREIVHQLRDVLRLSSGDVVVFADGKSLEAVCRLTAITRERAEAEILETELNDNEPSISVSLYCSLLKRENFELVAQKATEAGVSRIIPVVSKRTVKLSLNSARIGKIIKEAAEQSGRGIVPDLAAPISFDEALEECAKSGVAAFILDCGAPLMKPSNIWGKKQAGLFIGPEGGWDAEEIEKAKACGCVPVSLGKLTFRAETAAIAACFLASYLSAEEGCEKHINSVK